MRRSFLFILCILLVFTLAACGTPEQSDTEGLPPAFSILQKQITLDKQSEKGSGAVFSKEDFVRALGCDFSQITLKSLPDSSSGTLIFSGEAVAEGQTVSAESIGFLKFVPNQSTESTEFVFSCDAVGYENAEIKCRLVFGDSPNLAPIALDSNITTVEGIALGGELCINEPNGDPFTVNVVTYPREGFIEIDSEGGFVYYPSGDFSGKDTMVYTVTDRFGSVSQKATLKIQVNPNESRIVFADMQDDLLHLHAHRMCSNNIMVYRYENGSYYFDPEKAVSKLDFLVMLMSLTGQDTDITAVADSVISDDTGLSSGLMGYLSAAAERGIIQLDNGSFSPKSEITVADAAFMISQSLGLPKPKSDSASSDSANDTLTAMLAAANAGFFEILEPEKALSKAETAKLLCAVEDYMLENNMKQ